MLDEIEQRFRGNLARVENLLDLYEHELGLTGQGRRPTHATDILRATVVLLHASLEELVRSVARWKWPSGPPEVLQDVPLARAAGHEIRPSKSFKLSEMLEHRGKTVDELIQESVDCYLDTEFAVSNNERLVGILKNAGVREAALEPYLPPIAQMIRRRHLIVHHADRNPLHGQGQHKATSIGTTAVREWLGCVRLLGAEVLRQMRNPIAAA